MSKTLKDLEPYEHRHMPITKNIFKFKVTHAGETKYFVESKHATAQLGMPKTAFFNILSGKNIPKKWAKADLSIERVHVRIGDLNKPNMLVNMGRVGAMGLSTLRKYA